MRIFLNVVFSWENSLKHQQKLCVTPPVRLCVSAQRTPRFPTPSRAHAGALGDGNPFFPYADSAGEIRQTLGED